jgi:hypothetical protein
LPLLYLLFRLGRIALAKDTNAKADHVYQATLYRLHMAGFEREAETPLEYAEKTIDPNLGIHFADFMRMYLRLKYSNGVWREGDDKIINQLATEIGSAVRKKNGVLKSIVNYFNVFRASRFFQNPISTENETTSV